MDREPVDTAVADAPAPDGPAAALAAVALLSACGGGGSGGDATPGTQPASPPVPPPAPTRRDAARFLMQASFGPRGVDDIDALVAQGFDAWLNTQFERPTVSQLAYLESQRGRDQKAGDKPRVSEEMSYEAIWQQWLWGEDPLRGRMSWALLQIFVISNIAPDLRPHAMSSYMDILNRHAFGSWRELLEAVTLQPAMGYYLNMLGSEKADAKRGTHPNENFPREVLQLFSIGLIQLNLDGTPRLDAQGQTQPTFDEAVVKGFARAFSGWGFGGLNTADAKAFRHPDENNEALWQRPMEAWPAFHEPGDKLLLDGRVLPAGQTPQQDLKEALDTIFQHPNVPPFFCRQLIQRLVSSNPSPAYLRRVAEVFVNDGSGQRGNLRAVLLDPEARGDNPPPRAGKLREPVLRFAAVLRALQARSDSGFNRIHYLDSADEALGQSPLLAPSVFNFYAPEFRPAGPLAQAGLNAPEFQITSETSAAGSLNFFYQLFGSGGYGWPEAHRVRLQLDGLRELAGDAKQLVDRLELLFFALAMSETTRQRLTTLINATKADQRSTRVKHALTLVAMSPDFVVQR